MNKKMRFLIILLLLYNFLIVYWMFFGFERTTQSNYHYNLILLKTILTIVRFNKENTIFILINIFGNIFAFIPFGLILTILFKKKWHYGFLIFFLFVILLETLQLISKRGTFDVDDILLNTIGFFVGSVFVKIAKFIRNKS